MSWLKQKRIFLDYASATPVLPEVRRAMKKYWSRDFYNPLAIYEEGLQVKKEVEEFRTKIARLLGVTSESIIFTSGGTEANTWAIRGLKNLHIIIDELSHPSVLEAANGINHSTYNLKNKFSIEQNTTLISTVRTDNKIGRQVREWRKTHNSQTPLLHIDASQTAQYFNVGLEILSCDLITLDSAKLYGPKGIGVLVVRRGLKLDLPPLGTPPVPLIAGFSKAFEIAVRDREGEHKRLTSLSNLFMKNVEHSLSEIEMTQIEPNIVNISAPAILPEFLVLALDRAGVLVSAGPACNSNKPEPKDTPVRFSLGRFTTKSDVERAVKIFCSIAKSMVK
jgi:cysteine desulfurase